VCVCVCVFVCVCLCVCHHAGGYFFAISFYFPFVCRFNQRPEDKKKLYT